MASLVPVDRKDRDAGIAAVRAAAEVVKQGINMTIFVEGGRSFDGKLLPFKKGPFYLAEECQVPVVPVTISGTHFVMPKKRLAIKPGPVTVTFHQPIEPSQNSARREDLMEKVASDDQQRPPDANIKAEEWSRESFRHHRIARVGAGALTCPTTDARMEHRAPGLTAVEDSA